jgi:hypothetical protein
VNMVDGSAIWRLHATHGVPLDISVPECGRRGIMITWLKLLIAADKDGANWTTLIPRLCTAIEDGYPRELSGPICRRLRDIAAMIPDYYDGPRVALADHASQADTEAKP